MEGGVCRKDGRYGRDCTKGDYWRKGDIEGREILKEGRY
jgi:hypothetical protein